MPARVIATIPKGIALPNRGAMRMEISTRPVAASRTSGSEILPNPDLRSGISHDHLCVAQADKRDKQADAGGCSVFEAIRYGVDDLLANVAQRKQDSREKYYSER